MGAVLPLAISLVTIPIYLDLIGAERYGVLAIVWLLLGYFGLLDLGLGRATAQRIGSLRQGTPSQIGTAFWTAISVNICLGLAAGLIIWPLAYYVFGSAVTINAELRLEMLESVHWLALSMPFALMSGVLTGALIGQEKFLDVNVIAILGAAMIQVLPLLAVVLWGPKLSNILLVVFLSRALTILALFSRCRYHVCPNQPIVFEHAEASCLLKFGGWVTVSSVVGPMMVIFDRILIGGLSGAAAVTTYTVPFQLAERTTMLARSVAGALYPRLSGLENDERMRLAQTGQSAIICLATPLSGLAILLVEPFLSIWISPEFGQNAATVGIIFMVGFWMNCFAVVPLSLLHANGRPDQVAKLYLSELLPYFIFLYFGIRYWGLTGAALAFSVRSSLDALLLCWLAGLYRTSMRALMEPIIAICAIFLVAINVQPGSSIWFILSLSLISITLIRAWRTLPQSIKAKISSSISTDLR